MIGNARASGAPCRAARYHPCGGGPPPCPDAAARASPRDYAAAVTSEPPPPTASPAPATGDDLPDRVLVRPARTADVRAIRALVSPLAETRVLLQKEAVGYYETVGDFVVAERDGVVVGCGALHVLWEDLGEVRTLAVEAALENRGIGSVILERLVTRARDLGVSRLFCLTFETAFFARHGFEPIEGQAVEPDVYAELLRSYDEGVAEFLDLERVKPNTLGNTRMLRRL
ncbi:amino-acid N-acetyltransferase [Phycicoccus sp. BSK3Z-2]|uniref:Amino-acid N-acetyltransferase n=1 Tax=Phycicoccus avicenniae TaxID=2828860 RepID=A0A941HZ90_9MICO|nr:amino-acid N-acetyltransferase [Phycicoccus avicenniae]